MLVAAALTAAGCAGFSDEPPLRYGRSLPTRPVGHEPGVPMPNPRLTPGAVFAHVDLKLLCSVGYPRHVAPVPTPVARQVSARYGVAPARASGYQLDHLVPVALAGADNTTNLWPQPLAGRGSARTKDGLEDYLHDQVCAKRLALRVAQREIARDWYRTWLTTGRPTG